MKRLTGMVLLLMWAGHVAAAATANPPRSAEGPLAVRAHLEEGRCASSRLTQCVLGRLNAGQPVYLLDPRRSEVCASRALGTFMAGSLASGDFAVTQVDTSACPGIGAGIAVTTPSPSRPEYRLIVSPETAPRDAAAKVDAAVRAGYQRLAPASTEHPSQLGPRTPQVFRLASQAAGTYIAVYENARIPGDSTHVLYANGKLRLIHPSANIRAIFMLGKSAYIHYAFDCKIGCGWRGDLIVEFSGEDLQTVLFDDAGSA